MEVLTCLDHTGEGRLVMSDETRTLHWGRQRRLGLVEVLTSFLSHREASILCGLVLISEKSSACRRLVSLLASILTGGLATLEPREGTRAAT